MKLLFRDVRAKKRKALLMDINSIARQEIEETLDKLVKPALIQSHEVIVKDWKHKPDFGARKTIKPDVITIYVFPLGPDADIWTYVDQGTKPHVIMAKRAPLLKFRYPYKSKTLAKPARTVSGGGKYGPNWASKVLVHHPGTEAREFSKVIAEDIQPDFKRLIENAFRRTADKASE